MSTTRDYIRFINGTWERLIESKTDSWESIEEKEALKLLGDEKLQIVKYRQPRFAVDVPFKIERLVYHEKTNGDKFYKLLVEVKPGSGTLSFAPMHAVELEENRFINWTQLKKKAHKIWQDSKGKKKRKKKKAGVDYVSRKRNASKACIGSLQAHFQVHVQMQANHSAEHVSSFASAHFIADIAVIKRRCLGRRPIPQHRDGAKHL